MKARNCLQREAGEMLESLSRVLRNEQACVFQNSDQCCYGQRWSVRVEYPSSANVAQ